MKPRPCAKNGCERPAAGYIGFDLYEPDSVTRLLIGNKPATTAITRRECCTEHVAQVTPLALYSQREWHEVMRAAENKLGVHLDPRKTIARLVSYSDPYLIHLIKAGLFKP